MSTEVQNGEVANCLLAELPPTMTYSSSLYLHKPEIPILSLSSQIEKTFQSSKVEYQPGASSPCFLNTKGSQELTEELNMDDDLSSQKLTESLFSLWLIVSKCPESIENGRRLENISWRLWNREVLFNSIETRPENLENFETLINGSKNMAPTIPSLQKPLNPIKNLSEASYASNDPVNHIISPPSCNKSHSVSKSLVSSSLNIRAFKSKRTLSTARLQQIVSIFKSDTNLSTDYNLNDNNDRIRYFNQLRTEVKRLKISSDANVNEPAIPVLPLPVVSENSPNLLPETLSNKLNNIAPTALVKAIKPNSKSKSTVLSKKQNKNKTKVKRKSNSAAGAKKPARKAGTNMFFIEGSTSFSDDETNHKILKARDSKDTEDKKSKSTRQSKLFSLNKQHLAKSTQASTKCLPSPELTSSEWDSVDEEANPIQNVLSLVNEDDIGDTSFLHKDISKSLNSRNHLSKLSSLLLNQPDRIQEQLEVNRRKVESANTLLKRSASRGKIIDAALSNKHDDIEFNKPYFVSNDFKNSSASNSLKEVSKLILSSKSRPRPLKNGQARYVTSLSESFSVDSQNNTLSNGATIADELLRDAAAPVQSQCTLPKNTETTPLVVSSPPALISSSEIINPTNEFSDLSESLVQNVERQRYLVDNNLNRTQRTKSLFNCQNLYKSNDCLYPRFQTSAEVSVSLNVTGHCEQWKVDMDLNENADFNYHARGW